MIMRNAARRLGQEVSCHRGFLTAKPGPNMTMQQALGRFTKNQQRAAMGWLTHGGPFWDDLPRHGPDDYLECRGEVVTGSAVGEAAYRKLHAAECALISVTPSDWNFSPVEVTWQREDVSDQQTDLNNYWRDVSKLEEMLHDAALPIQSWDDLRAASTIRFNGLTFAGNCFKPLADLPFVRSTAERFLVLLDILDRFTRAFDTNGIRTREGQQIYQDYFAGDNALFSDSSVSEKNRYRKELTFSHPNDPRQFLFCPWHGKEHHLTYRLHFSWPIEAGKPVYVVYAGPKITKR